MDTIKCLRCNSKDAVYSCMQCDSFKFLCTRCDSYVHSLPSKNKHRRNSLCNIEEQKDTQHMNTTFNPPQMTLPNNNTNLFSKNFEQNEFKEILNQEYREEENTSKGVENVHHSQLGACSMDYKSNTSYSREYLNEFKAIMEKEKSELLFKNASLQNNLDRLKISFTDQLSTVNSELNEIHKKHCMQLQTIQTNSEEKIHSILEEKDKHISFLENKITKLEQINYELVQKQSESIKNQSELKQFYAEQLKEMETKLKEKEEENSSLRSNFNREMTQTLNQQDEEKRKLIFDYERRIEKLWRELEDNKRRLANINNERDDEIRHILDTHNYEINKFIESNKEIQHELECHKVNLMGIRNKKELLTQEIGELKELIENMKKELHLRNTEVKILEDKNRSFIKENDELKIQCSKLEKLVYGKVKANFRR